MSKDGEGNYYSPLYLIEECKYKAEYNDIYIKELTPELIGDGFTEEDLCEDGENAIVLYPN
jgi:hypothetical protein